MKIIEIKAKEIFTKTKLGADWVVNPYAGCAHQCLYCYAKFIAKWKPVEYGKWGSWVEAKINGPELVKAKKVKGEVFMSSICDAYQPVEKELRLTRRILENMDKNVKLSILTKSDLVLRDIDIFKQFKNIEVGLTINSFTNKAKEFFEPAAIAVEKRIIALQKLKEQGISVYAFVSPIIPGLIHLSDIINKTKNLVNYYWFEFLNLRGAGKEFVEVLQKEFPESYKIVSNATLYQEFIERTTNLINSSHIKIRGIVKH
ncbi:MAG: radical SAM protein [Candidatus Gribaldobacteria bacterium]|nr:radical SAM protein [Candidatus Gribaldobacteria bacterium]